MDALRHIAEAKIRDAIARGDFDDLPGKGRPLELEDLSRVPEDLRASYVMLKNAGVLPEEMQLRKEMLTLRDLIAACQDDGERDSLRRDLSARSIRLQTLIEQRLGGSSAWSEYGPRVRAKLGRRR